jgi:hypothetical protein
MLNIRSGRRNHVKSQYFETRNTAIKRIIIVEKPLVSLCNV